MEKKFDSLFGISMDAPNPGDKIRIKFSVNCKDYSFSDLYKLEHIQSYLDEYVYPEVIQRSKQGNLSNDFKLTKAQSLCLSRLIQLAC